MPFGPSRGRRFGLNPCRETPGSREEDRSERLIDQLNMRMSTPFRNAVTDMSAMHVAQRKVRVFDPNENVLEALSLKTMRPCSRGEQGLSLKEAMTASRKEERHPARRERNAG